MRLAGDVVHRAVFIAPGPGVAEPKAGQCHAFRNLRPTVDQCNFCQNVVLGRFGVFSNLTFKVFPKPENYVTVRAVYPGLGSVLEAVYLLSSSSYDMDALDLEPLASGEWQLLVRVGGLSGALAERSARLVGFLRAKSELSASEVIGDEAETELWQAVNRFDWLPTESQLVKVPVSPPVGEE